MIKLIETDTYSDWLFSLRDRTARTLITLRSRRLVNGNFGDAKSVGSGVFELRVHYGPGYRVYFTQQGQELVLLLVGGEKRTQKRDIVKAQEIARAWEVQNGKD
ncbi:TPA: addiction module antitoxin RelB [Candidatus Sumerlaeota bacterium]|jgi:putative addiction module killer protein|nr:addiction module antitoxin RelB [Candidatus Sumerlaeota bacterium]